jgi:hypothetical protein
LANRRLAVGNFLDGENSLIIGDTENPRGGVRGVIKDKQSY